MADFNYGLSSDILPNPQNNMLQLNGVGTLPTIFSSQDAATRQNIAAPFLAMNQQGLANQLQNDQMKGTEFRSQLAQDTRQKLLQADMAKAQGTIDQTPYETIQAREKARQAPAMADAQIAKSRDEALQAQEAPGERAMKKMADVGMAISKLPPQQKAQAYTQWVQQELDSIQSPESKAKFQQIFGNPQTGMQALQLAVQRSYEGPDFYKKMEEQKLQNQGTERVAQIHAAATRDAAAMRVKDLDKEEQVTLTKAAAMGQPEALYMLADRMEQQAYQTKDFATNQALLQKAKELKLRAAQAQQRKIDVAKAAAKERNEPTNRLLFNDKGLTQEGSAYADDLVNKYLGK